MNPHDIKVLAFGDSITAGWRGRGVTQHSYTIRLGELLRDKFKGSKWRFAIDTKGQPGERAVDMLERHNKLRTQTYQIVILQGGGNDIRIALDEDAQRTDGVKIGNKIADALLEMAQHWIGTNAKVLLISRSRGENGDDFTSVALRTLHQRLTDFALQNAERAKVVAPGDVEIDSDHGHPTRRGNDALGAQFFEHILPFVEQIIARRSGDDTRERDRSRSPTRKQST